MLRPHIILSALIICLLSVGTVPLPIGRIKTSVTMSSVKREVQGMDLPDDPVPQVPLARNSIKELPNLSYFEKQLLKREPQLSLSPTPPTPPPPPPPSEASNLVTELASSTVMTSPPTREALNDLHSFEKALNDLQHKREGDAINTASVSNLESVPENLRNVSEEAILQKHPLENGADSKYESEKRREEANKALEYAANRNSKNVSENQLIPPISESAVNLTPSIDESAVPPFSPQPKMDLPTAKFPAYKELETPTKSSGQAPPTSIPSEHFTPSVDLMKESLPQREPGHVNKPLLEMAEELRLQNVMGKAQNMPLQYDASKTVLQGVDLGNHPRQNWESSSNSASMKWDDSQRSVGKDPMKMNALLRTPFPSGDVSNKDKFMSRFFPHINQQPNKQQPPFLPQHAVREAKIANSD